MIAKRRGSRRHFLTTAATSALGLGLGLPRCHADASDAVEQLDVRIVRALRCQLNYERPRIVAGNSRYRRAGKRRSDSVLMVFGNNGKIGIGACRRGAKEADGQALLNQPLSQLLTEQSVAINRGTGTSALWDLAGKSLDKPIYQLLGGEAPSRGVPVYDGSIYHEELLSRDHQSANRNANSTYGKNPGWHDIIKESIDSSITEGHRFVKVKIGRGAKHLSRKAGNYQDAAVLQLIRQHAGDDFGIGIDANNGYSPADTIWLLEECGHLNLAFMEEMFPDDVENYRQIRSVLSDLRLKTLVADGEGWRSPEDPLAKEMIQSGVVDVLQGDMRQFEFEGILEEARLAIAAGHGSRIAPHNWGSELGFYMQIHVACAIPNFYRAEHDPGRAVDDVLIKHGYKIEAGFCTQLDAPGLGIDLNRQKLDDLRSSFDLSS